MRDQSPFNNNNKLSRHTSAASEIPTLLEYPELIDGEIIQPYEKEEIVVASRQSIFKVFKQYYEVLARNAETSNNENIPSKKPIELKEAKSIDILEDAPIDPKTWVFILFIY